MLILGSLFVSFYGEEYQISKKKKKKEIQFPCHNVVHHDLESMESRSNNYL